MSAADLITAGTLTLRRRRPKGRLERLRQFLLCRQPPRRHGVEHCAQLRHGADFPGPFQPFIRHQVQSHLCDRGADAIGLGPVNLPKAADRFRRFF